jgi:hypothetical protein
MIAQSSSRAVMAGMIAALCVTPAAAAVTISTAATNNMSCVSGVCTPTAKKAVLNVGDLTTMLGSGNVVVNTGAGLLAKQVKDIVVAAAFNWASASSLTLGARRSIAINQSVSVSGPAALTLTTNAKGEAGTLSFGTKGSISFLGTTNLLTINGNVYTLQNTIASLAGAIASNPAGYYALANSYNAGRDGVYSASPIGTTFTGSFEGLGNTISHLLITDSAEGPMGLFSETAGGALRDLHIVAIAYTGRTLVSAGGLVGIVGAGNASTIIAVSVSGSIQGGDDSEVGGLVGIDDSEAQTTIQNCIANVNLTGGDNGYVGGIVGDVYSSAVISKSHASGTLIGGVSGFAGGLVGSLGFFEQQATITQSYATASVSAGDYGYSGGLVGEVSHSTVENSFASGPASAGNVDPNAGGLVGYNLNGTLSNVYALGAATVGSGDDTTRPEAGGLAGFSEGGVIGSAYSTGAVTGGAGALLGGFIGSTAGDALANDYWDTSTSGITNLSQGAGNVPNDPGITGLTTTQLQSGLPSGFDPKIWAEDRKINHGFPYLINNPPPAS